MSFEKWIDCNEKMPSEQGEYLVTMASTIGENYVECLDYGYVYNDDENMCFHSWDSEMWQCFRPKNVVAWMPFPKPYVRQ